MADKSTMSTNHAGMPWTFHAGLKRGMRAMPEEWRPREVVSFRWDCLFILVISHVISEKQVRILGKDAL
jgi:hypothetical protein